jgi:hypothetical protein
LRREIGSVVAAENPFEVGLGAGLPQEIGAFALVRN